ncbi:hypothetical protein HY463_00285 [Candidatus Peregrinibacteria bacterium]|nr:hypothetical protein [Candidatus Peregrinibacteria bacterium]
MLGEPIYPGSNGYDEDWDAKVRNNTAHVPYEGPLGPDYVHAAAAPVENFAGGDFGEYAGPIGPGELYGDGPTAGSYDGHFNYSSRE